MGRCYFTIKGGFLLMKDLEVFKGIVNIRLYQQVNSFISRSGGLAENILQHNLFYIKDKLPLFEDDYDLNYVGELFERYREKIGEERQYLRAIALAVAERKNELSKTMYVGTQYIDFMKVLQRSAKGDIYILGALYKIKTKYEDKRKLLKQMFEYEYEKTEEILFVLFILQDVENSWGIFYPMLEKLLGTNRTINIYQNIFLYCWFIQQYFAKIKEHSKRDMPLLKALVNLPMSSFKEGTRYWRVMQENGYNENEIIFLNNILVGQVQIVGHVEKKSITAERMAYAACLRFLNGSYVNESILELCANLLREYKRYEVKLDGYSGLNVHLTNKISINDPMILQYFYHLKTELDLSETWFWVDVSADGKWDILSSWMSEDDYMKLFDQSIAHFYRENINLWLQIFQKNTSRDYEMTFWSSHRRVPIFKILVDAKIISLVELLEMYIKDEVKLDEEKLTCKWEVMWDYVLAYIKEFNNHITFAFLKSYLDYYGQEQMCELIKDNMLIMGFGIDLSNLYYASGFQKMQIIKNFLKEDEQREVFGWIERTIYMFFPKDYVKFIIHLLEKGFLLDYYSHEQIQKITSLIVNDSNIEEHIINSIYKKYYSDKEYINYINQLNCKKELLRQQENEEIWCKKKDELQEILIKNTDNESIFGKIQEYFKEFCWERTHHAEILQYLYSMWDKVFGNEKIILSRQGLYEFAESLLRIWKHTELSFLIVQEILNRLEEKHD